MGDQRRSDTDALPVPGPEFRLRQVTGRKTVVNDLNSKIARKLRWTSFVKAECREGVSVRSNFATARRG